MEKIVPLRDRGTIHKNGTPTIRPISTRFRKRGTILVPFLPEGYCFEAKKMLKTVPFFQRGTKTVPFFHRGTVSEQKRSKTVPLWRREPF